LFVFRQGEEQNSSGQMNGAITMPFVVMIGKKKKTYRELQLLLLEHCP